jgi:hypothetical protein
MLVRIRYDDELDDRLEPEWWAECRQLDIRVRAPTKNDVIAKMQAAALHVLARKIERGETWGYSYVLFEARCLRRERAERALARHQAAASGGGKARRAGAQRRSARGKRR